MNNNTNAINLINPFEPAKAIREKVIAENLYPSNMIFSNIALQDFSSKVFRDVPDADANALLILHEGFDTYPDGREHKTLTNTQRRLRFKTRIITVSPSKLYYENAGAKFIEMIELMKSLTVESCMRYGIIEDVHEFNEPSYSNNMVGLPILYGFEVTT